MTNTTQTTDVIEDMRKDFDWWFDADVEDGGRKPNDPEDYWGYIKSALQKSYKQGKEDAVDYIVSHPTVKKIREDADGIEVYELHPIVWNEALKQ